MVRMSRYVLLAAGPSKSFVQASASHRCFRCAFRIACALVALVFGFSLYYRTTNVWALKNLGDAFIHKSIGLRPIVIGAFHRFPREKHKSYAVIQFLGDTQQAHRLYCISGKDTITTALTQRIHQGKRAVNDVCMWAGHLAVCEISPYVYSEIRLTTNPEWKSQKSDTESLSIMLEDPLKFGPKKLDLVVCVAPLYIYTEWQILVTGVETWLALGATKLIFPVQSVSNDTWKILKEYERQGVALIRYWPKWPVLSDVNPNGLVLSRGIEESHVNCLHFAKPFADMIVFTDIDDMLLPLDPMKISPTVNVEILKNLFAEHPNAGSLLFEHRDVQFVLPKELEDDKNSLANFKFDFLLNSNWKMNCKVWRMKTRVAVNASRVDTVNMHETGVHRFGYVQTRVPCQKAHFYHLRHSYRQIALNEWKIRMNMLAGYLNERWMIRLRTSFDAKLIAHVLEKASTESFEDFDRCVSAITEEHYMLKVSRCMTPHVCYAKLPRKMGCMVAAGDYEFTHVAGDFLIIHRNSSIIPNNDGDCEAPLPKYIRGTYFYLP